ncbi:MAG: hypothetical protein ACXWUG_16195 [Polyangiales bacterium]
MRFACLAAFVFLAGCSSKETNTTTVDSGPGGGPVTGTAPDHCAGKKQATDEASCHPTDAGMDDAHMHDDASATDSGSEAEPAGGGEYQPTMVGTKADDDQCKYHVEWTITPTHVNEDQTVTVTITRLADGKPATGAQPNLEIFLDETHPAPNSGQKPTETSPGTYAVGPVRFDASGKWTVRFHLYEDCVDGDTSPHGHVAFFVTVP